MSVNRNVTVPTGLAPRVSVADLYVSDAAAPSRDRRRAASPRRIDERERRAVEQGLLEVPAGEGEAARRLDGDDLGDARQAVEDRQLAEELAGPEDADLLAAADDPDRPRRRRGRSRSRSRPGGRSHGRPGSRPRSARSATAARSVRRTPANSGQAPSNSVRRSCVSVNGSSMSNRDDAGAARGGSRQPASAAVAELIGATRCQLAEEPSPMATREEIVDEIAGFALFADLATPQLERRRPHVRGAGLRGRRAGASPGPVRLGVPRDPRRRRGGRDRRQRAGDARPRRLLRRGLDPARRAARSPTSSRSRQLRCLVLAGHLVQPFLLDNPPVMYRMLQAQARRLRNANRWRS